MNCPDNNDASPATKTPLRVLVVDDDRVDRMALEDAVGRQHLPYDVAMAASVQEAIERLGETDYDVVLLDFRLTDGTGLDVLDHLGGTPASSSPAAATRPPRWTR